MQQSQGQSSKHGRMNSSLKSEGYGDKVIQQLNNLRSRNELCDFKVSAGEKSFQVHKALLAATSDYFRVMFGGAMAESKQDSVDLKGVTADGLQMIIDFVYSGELSLEYDNLTEAINTASHLQVSSALDICSDYIIAGMTFENAQDFLTIATTYSLDKVLKHWDKMILSNFVEFSETQCFLKMEAVTLVKYLCSNALRASSEYKIFQCLDKWFKHNPTRISNDCVTVLTHIRFPLMSERELQMVQESELMKRCLGALHLVTKGFKYHLDCRERHPVIEERSNVRTEIPTLVLIQPHNSASYVPFQITSYDHVTGVFYRLYSDLNGSRDCRLTVIDNFIYICRVVDFGGGSLMSSLFRFDPRHLCGQELRPMLRLRMDFAMVAHGSCLYVFGGSTEQFATMDSVECYNVKTNTWTEMPPLPMALNSLAALTVERKVYLSGGASQDRQPTNSFTIFHPHYQTYETLPGMFYARRLHEMVFFQEKVYVLGGIPRQGVPLHGQIPIECYDVSTSQWTMLSSTLSGRSVGHYLSFQGYILSLGHEHHNAKEDEIWTYDPEVDGWSKYAKAPQRMSLMSVICSTIFVNFHDEKVAKQNNSSTTIDNATVITRTNNESIAQITSSENETSTPVPPSKPDENDAFLDLSQATTSMTPSSEYSLSNDDVTSTHGNATFTTISKQDCTTSYNILQSLCTEDLPSLVKIANIWDIYYVMFSDDVINELLLNCASGEWCIQDEFDIFRAKMAEKADMVTRSAVFAETCQELSLGCLDTAAQKFESCSFGKRLNFTLEAVRLMCAIRVMTSSNQQCLAQVLSSLHVTIMDILRKENEKQDLNTAFDNEVCRTTQSLMTKTYLCTSSRCPTDIKDVLGSFKPWSWFLDDINELKATCQLGNNTCTSRDMVFIIDEAAPTAITTASVFQTDETQQFNEDSGLVDIRSSPIALAGIGTATFIMLAGMIIFFLFFVRRHRVTSKNHEYKPLETSEP